MMVNPTKSEGKKSDKFWIVLICGVLLVSYAVSLILGQKPAATARVYSDGELVRSLDLSEVEEPYTFTVEFAEGINVIAVEYGRVCVAEANCSDGSCIRQGWVSGGVTPIVCLPHRLVIELDDSGSGGTADLQEVDAVVG